MTLSDEMAHRVILAAADEEIQKLRTQLAEAHNYLREKNEIIKAYAGPTGMTPEDVARKLDRLDRVTKVARSVIAACEEAGSDRVASSVSRALRSALR
jgi:DNA repair ATPase RecN